ncbi:hypothetical protein [Streptomyces sp. NPDC093568]|uniref:hypothetical protein n=1 Tax=Streptomyces sp. NPDC093568 TaxID=3366041 RepID=UPI0037FB9B4F
MRRGRRAAAFAAFAGFAASPAGPASTAVVPAIGFGGPVPALIDPGLPGVVVAAGTAMA